MMKEVKLSEKAKQQIVGLEATNERLLAEGLELEARTKELEALAQRKENMVRRSSLQRIQGKLQRVRAITPFYLASDSIGKI